MGFWGSVKNAVLGGLGKAPDPNAARYGDRDYLAGTAQQGIADAQNRQAPQAGRTTVGQVAQGQAVTGGASSIDQRPQGQFRNVQQSLLSQLGGVASGQQAGAGELAVQRQVGQALASQQAMARSARGAGAGLAARGAARNAADVGVAGAGQAQMAAMQDQSTARGLMAQLAGQGREQDLGLATNQAGMNQQMTLANLGAQNQMGLANLNAQNQAIFQQAGLDQATSLANMQARLQQTGMNDQAALGYLAQLYGMNQAELMARMSQEQAAMGQQGLLGGLLSAGGTIGAAYAGRPG